MKFQNIEEITRFATNKTKCELCRQKIPKGKPYVFNRPVEYCLGCSGHLDKIEETLLSKKSYQFHEIF